MYVIISSHKPAFYLKKKREREVVLNKCLLNIMQVIFLKVVLNVTKFAFEYCRCN